MAPRPSCCASSLKSASSLVPTCRSRSTILPFLLPFAARRHAATKPSAPAVSAKEKRRKEKQKYFKREDMSHAQSYALCDAMRYLRAIEVGRSPTTTKYELAISLRTIKNGPVVRNRVQLPHPVEGTQRVAVLCPSRSPAAREARRQGAVLVGEDEVLRAVKAGRIEFERLLCHPASQEALNKAGVGRILGPKGLMPSPKTGTLVADVGQAMAEMKGATQYREKEGVVRLPIGQLGFTPDMMMANIKLLMSVIKREAGRFQDKLAKEIHEVVLSSTNGPGFPLNGDFRSEQSLSTKELSVL